ncbi:MAG: hypothetical protein PHS86_03905 [Syntrophaceae bacterium]|nr:hypothetical protein [Syntrophaceae bacterium]
MIVFNGVDAAHQSFRVDLFVLDTDHALTLFVEPGLTEFIHRKRWGDPLPVLVIKSIENLLVFSEKPQSEEDAHKMNFVSLDHDFLFFQFTRFSEKLTIRIQ